MPSGSIVKQATAKARLTGGLALVGAALIVGGVLLDRTTYQRQQRAATERLMRAQEAADLILLADERLTMSANMAAATGEPRWVERYEADIPLIDAAIRATIELAPADVAARFDAATRIANDRLVELERASFEAVRAGDLEGARALLDSAAYARHKRTLSAGTSRLTGDVIAAVRAELEAVGRRALAFMCLVVLAAGLGATLLWRQLKTSLARSEAAFLEAESTIRDLALNDVLTGIPNRRALRETLRKTLADADRTGSKIALLMIDLDRFKPVNDRHGHVIGDLVLIEVAQRLSQLLREGELRARFGGDEFVAVVDYRDDDDIAARIGRRLIESLSAPMTFDGVTVQIGASVGIAIYPTDATHDDELLRKADVALYRAKQDGRGRVRPYDPSMDVDIDARAALEEELRAAIEAGEVVPYFQPLVDLGSGAVHGFEVLCRWRHPTRGVLQPADFIPLAEAGGLIDALTTAVLRTACREAQGLPETMTLAVNVAPQQIQDEGLAEKILAVLAETGFPPERLEIELTENALVNDLAAAKRVITLLKGAGIRIALDDFGTGYSSLCYLSELPFDKIKIDRSFIQTLHERQESAKIISAIVGLGKSLGVPTIAEGVETADEVDFLRRIGCSTAQGYYFSEPLLKVPATGPAARAADQALA
jgi:diguanylate cyclase (GGDEF)-like protein